MNSFLETLNGRVAILICTVDSNPPSTLVFRRAGKVLAASAFRGKQVPGHRLSAAASQNTLRLEIKEVGLDDEGKYECLASNSLGETVASLDLTVQSKSWCKLLMVSPDTGDDPLWGRIQGPPTARPSPKEVGREAERAEKLSPGWARSLRKVPSQLRFLHIGSRCTPCIFWEFPLKQKPNLS